MKRMRTMLIIVLFTFLHIRSTARIVVGAQFGDEGKGKMADYLSSQADIVVRSQGGNNAGHTMIVGDQEYKLHLVPSGILQPHTQCLLTAGVVINPKVLLDEIAMLESRGITVQGRLWISPNAHVIFPYHEFLDGYAEMKRSGSAIGTTRRGIGPCYADKVNRVGVRISDLMDPERLQELVTRNVTRLHDTVDAPESLSCCSMYDNYCEYAQQLKPFVRNDCEQVIDAAITSGRNVLFEGAQATFLDNTFGTFPYVTSSCTLSAGICAGAGIGPTRIDECIATVKAFTTRVGNGPFVTELHPEQCPIGVKKSREIGTTTGRHRRIGWFDSVLVKTAVRLNGATALALTKLDVLDALESIRICTGYRYNGKVYDEVPAGCTDLNAVTPVYETMKGWLAPTSHCTRFDELPAHAQAYVERIEQLSGAPVRYISVGPERTQTMIK